MGEAKQRAVERVVDAVNTLEGGGFPVRRPFPTQVMAEVDPFLLLDHLGPVDWPPGEAIGAPDHPHRGFETVTYLLAGRWEHKDSQGHAALLGPGDVQWMTAGAGVVHSEMPEAEFKRAGGVLHGFQIWVNLPARDKMMPPRYQDVAAAEIPQATSADGKVRVRVIAGESLGARAVIDTRTPIAYLHFTLEPGGAVEQPVAPEHNALVYVFSGEARIGPEARTVTEGQAAALSPGEAVRIAAPPDGAQPAELLLLSGVPLNEPVARYGPFVMNTEQEIVQAMDDYQAGRMGHIGV